jgi:hypothetical protein
MIRKILHNITLIALITCFSFLTSQSNKVYASEYNENQIKLAFILKVIDFIDKMPTDTKNLDLCIYGFSKDEVNIISEDLKYSKSYNIELTNSPSLQKITKCNIVFFHNDYDNYKNILDYTKDYPILSFAEIKYFTDYGGLVEFYKYKGKYKFLINNELAIKKDIFFNAKLLEISK